METLAGLDPEALDRARLSRDARFDGKFFIAITSTGIYCRPICPSRFAKRSHVRFFGSTAAAEAAGFRPCLRCRPEAAPGTPAWLGTAAVVRRALRLIDDGALDEDSVDALAARLGVGCRHLVRLFARHVGASPIAVAQTRRLHFAVRLLEETDLSITGIAMAAGFGSSRRFNDAFQSAYRRSPRELRQARRRGMVRGVGGQVVLRLAYRPPYDWVHLQEFLAQRAIRGVERVDAAGYARTLAYPGGHALIAVRALAGQHALELRVTGAPPSALLPLASAARRVFDLAGDPARIGAELAADPLIGPLVAERPGLRIPGVWDPFECAVRAVLGQQVSVAAGRTLAGRLVERSGQPLRAGAEGLTHLFPTPASLARSDLGGLGITTTRAAALKALARAVLERRVDFSAAPAVVAAALAALRGIGPWTAQYVALRALGEPDAFPYGDWVLRRMAAPQGAEVLSAQKLEERSRRWRPWRGYAAVHLWRAAGQVPLRARGKAPAHPAVAAPSA
ncbi:MAG TPA: AlkA N-terminal domain-containing protein [Steroidobacteraceae bacterium]|nr:AlkA N-terminal domain-containing protein [Steroidobacteraceae bacterium]